MSRVYLKKSAKIVHLTKEERKGQMKKKALSAEEIKDLFIAQFKIEQEDGMRLTRYVGERTGIIMPEASPEVLAITVEINELVSDIIARRLKRNRRDVALISPRDFKQLVAMWRKKVVTGPIQQKTFKSFLRTMLEPICQRVELSVSVGKNPYDEYWRWVHTVQALAAEQGVSPLELFANENPILQIVATQEVIRRMFTKEQFLALKRRAIDTLFSVELFKDAVIQMILFGAGEKKQEELAKLAQKIEERIMPQLIDLATNIKKAMMDWYENEAMFIYLFT
jgi:hypothetical protein